MPKFIQRAFFIIMTISSLFAGSALLADTLSLTNGQTIQGTFVSGNQTEINFRANGVVRRYSPRDVKAIEFAPLPLASNAARRWRIVDNSWVHLVYPANWQVTEQGERVLISADAVVNRRFRGSSEPSANVMLGMHREWGSQVQGLTGSSDGSLEEETRKILADLGGELRDLRETGTRQELLVDGRRAIRTTFTSTSDRGVRNLNSLMTVMHPHGVLYMVFSAPERDFPTLESTFQQMQNLTQIPR